MEEGLAVACESRSSIWHDPAALGGADLTTQVGLSGLAELAFFAFGCVEGDDVVAWLDGGDAGANRLHDAGSLVTENDWEGALGVLTGEGVGIWVALVADSYDLLSLANSSLLLQYLKRLQRERNI